MDHHIHRSVDCGPRRSHGFPYTTLDSTALYRAAQYLAHRESYTQRVISDGAIGCWGAAQEKHRHIAGELATSRLVNALKVCMSQQVLRLRKLIADSGHN